MLQCDSLLRAAAKAMAARMRLFRETARAATEMGCRVNLQPCELWEQEDQAALDAYEKALMDLLGARPLFEEGAHHD